MSYLALYRKYRPMTFGEVIGQEHITSTLANTVRSGNISHAYLFTGSRGTGKTTVAKIFARAVNCEHPLADGSPCGTCARCALKDNLDIMEIDAASNNGVDEVRELREKVTYQPVNGGHKVYIVDEVHMLTTEAFNALLKTLEEPPPHTTFILATTEVQKLPATILSRCMRFDFRLIGTDALVALVTRIFDEVGQKATPDAIKRIALAGAGSARDTLSIADMCRSFAPDGITYDDVLGVIGAGNPADIVRIAEDVLAGRAGAALTTVGELVGKGKAPAVIAKDLRTVLRDLGIVCVTEHPEKLLVMPIDLFDELKRIAATTNADAIAYCIDVIGAIETDLRYGLAPRIVLETALIKCCSPYGADNAALSAAVSALEKKVASLEECLRQEEE